MSMMDWRLVSLVLTFAGALVVAVCAVVYRRRSGAPIPGWRVAGSALLFGIAGPPVGGLVLGIPAILAGSDPEPFRLLAFFMLMSYFMAGIPAVVGGACAGLLRPVLDGWVRLAAVAWCCGLASALFGASLFSTEPAEAGLVMLGLGALSGGLIETALLALERRRARIAGTPEQAAS